MYRFTPIALLAACVGLVACSGSGDSSDTAPVFHPSLTFLTPLDGETEPTGDLGVSMVISEFNLVDPSTARADELVPAGAPLTLTLLSGTAWAHNAAGTPAGYCELTYDGTLFADLAATTTTLPGVTAGPHTLEAHLLYADGHPLDPDIDVSIAFTAAATP